MYVFVEILLSQIRNLILCEIKILFQKSEIVRTHECQISFFMFGSDIFQHGNRSLQYFVGQKERWRIRLLTLSNSKVEIFNGINLWKGIKRVFYSRWIIGINESLTIPIKKIIDQRMESIFLVF